MTRHAYRRFPSPWRVEPRVRHFGGAQVPVSPPQPDFVFPDFPSFSMEPISFPAPYDPTAAAAKQKRAAEVQAIKQIESKRKGYASTLLTGGLGPEEKVSTRRPSLIGR